MRRFALIVGVMLTCGGTAWGWWPMGHHLATRAAVGALPGEVPSFFHIGAKQIAHCAIDPDVAKNRGTPFVRGTEYPEHFIDLELLKDSPLPKDRYAYIALCYQLGVKPETVGFLPYALAEWTERLAVAFSEYRKWPDNPHIQAKCLVYAGFIAHYGEDLCQPLHLTIHYDGRAKEDGRSPKTGIHDKVDALIESLGVDAASLARGQTIAPMDDLMAGILKQMDASRALIDRVYALEGQLPSVPGEGRPLAAAVATFGRERAREAVRFTAALYLTAWKLSEKLQVPDWLDRVQMDQAAPVQK